MHMGLAGRWAASTNTGLTRSPKSFYERLEGILAASRDSSLLKYLSPAEKYDLLKYGIDKIPKQSHNELKVISGSLNANVGAQLKSGTEKLQKLDLESSVLFDKIEALEKTITDLGTKYDAAVASQSKPEAKSLSDQIHKLVVEAANISKNLSQIRTTINGINRELAQIRLPYQRQEYAVVKNLTPFLPMTTNSWIEWADNEMNGPTDYSWMGHCHGWATASLGVAVPKHGVLVQRGKEPGILFSEGDIRGLLSKLWAHQPPELFFGARRNGRKPSFFNDEGLDFSKKGRLGGVYDDANLRNAIFKNTKLWEIQLNYADLSGANFEGTVIQFSSLIGAILKGIKVSCDKKTIFSNVSLQNADFEGTDLRCVSFINSNLSGANLKGARLKRANIVNTPMLDGWEKLVQELP
jgi:hypothetical protein